MSNTIDNRVVGMQFDNKDFEKGVGQSVKSIDGLKKSLDFTATGKSLANLSNAAGNVKLGNIADSVEAINNRFSLLGIVGITIMQDLTRAAFDLAQKLFNVVLGVDSIKAGFGSYETKVNAIKTVMSGTGETIEEVTKSIADLNAYSDRTVYSFEDMTANISKFTNAGLGSKAAATAIQGISNVAAQSGANTQEAARAMYNFGQALSQGSVRLMDWKSIENANMATIEFKTQLLESAIAAGTLTRGVDGLYNVVSKPGMVISATKEFNNSLQEQWLTTDVLVKTLTDYASLETEIGKKANEAATQLKTWTQLMDNMADSMKTGWTTSFEYLFGDLNEATKLFTYFGDIVGATMGSAARSRNELLKGWHELGGRDLLLEGMQYAIEELGKTIKPIIEAFEEIFPPMTVDRLLALTQGVVDFIKQFKMGEIQIDKVKRVFKGLFAFLDIGRMLFRDIAKSIFEFSGSLKPGVDLLTNYALVLADYIVGLRDSIKGAGGFSKSIDKIAVALAPGLKLIKDFFNAIAGGFKSVGTFDTSGITAFFENLGARFAPLGRIADLLVKFMGLIGLLVKKATPLMLKLGSTIADGMSNFLDTLTNGLNDFDPTKIFTIINGGLFAGILLAIRNFISNGTGMFTGVGSILDTVKDSLTAWQNSLKADTLLKIAGALAILAIAVIGLSMVDADNLTAALSAMTVMFVELFASMSIFSKMGGGLGLTTASIGLIAISAALLILSAAAVNLGRLDSRELIRGSGALVIMITLLKGIAKELSGSLSMTIPGAIAIGILAVAIGLLGISIKKLGELNTGVLIQGLIGLGAILAGLAIFLKTAGGSKSMILVSSGLVILSGALLLMSAAIWALGSMPWETLTQGLLGMGAALLIVLAVMSAMPKDILLTGTGLVVVAGALLILAQALVIMGSMSWEEIGAGLAVLSTSLTILIVALSAMSGTLAGSASLIIAAGAIAILAVAMKALGSMSLEEIGLGLLAMVGAFTVIGLAATILTPVIPSLLGLAAAMALFGVAALGLGVGVLAFSIGLTALAAAGSAGAAALVLIISSIISLLPMIAKQLGVALISLITTIADGAPMLLEAIVTILEMIVDGLIQVIPKLVEAILLFVTTIMEQLAAALPSIVQAGYDIIIALLSGIRDNIGQITTVGYDIIINFLDAISEKLPELADAGFRFITSFIDAMADSAEKNIPVLAAALHNLGWSVVKGITKGIFAGRSEAIKGIKDLAYSILDEFKSVLGIKSPSTEFFGASGEIVGGLVGGLVKFGKDAYAAAKDLGTGIVSSFTSVTSMLTDAINSELELDPMIRPVIDLSDVTTGAKDMKSILEDPKLNVGLAVNRTASIANGLGVIDEKTGTEISPPASKEPTVQYVQNNYSPKALTPTEIYRQTHKQLIQTRKMAGV